MATPETLLCSVEDVAALVGGAPPLPRVTSLISLFSERFLGETGASFSSKEGEVLILDGSGSDTLALPVRPTAVASVEVKGHGGDWRSIAFDWSASGLLQASHGRFPQRYSSVRVTLDSGPSAGGVPADVRAAVAEAVAVALNTVPGRESVSLGSFSATFSGTSEGWVRAVRKYQVR